MRLRFKVERQSSTFKPWTFNSDYIPSLPLAASIYAIFFKFEVLATVIELSYGLLGISGKVGYTDFPCFKKTLIFPDRGGLTIIGGNI